MFRSAFTLALSLFLLAEASAQTAPVAPAKTAARKEVKAAKKATKASARAAKKAAKESERLAKKTAASKPATWADNDGWPPIDDATVVASAAAPADETFGETVVPVHNRHEDVVYAAPGTAVRIITTKKMVPYSVRPARKPAAQTTLGR